MTGVQMLVVASLSMLSFGPAQVRDNPVSLSRPHSGSLGGTVISDDDGRPVRRARVRISDGSRIWTAATDELGRFLVRDLAPGRYTIDVTKPPWINTAYGALRPGGAGMPIALGEDQHRTDFLLKMVRGAVLTGTVTDRNGRPLPGARVTVMRGYNNPVTGELTFDSKSR